MDEQNNPGILQSSRVAKLAVAFLAVATVLVGLQALSVLNNFNESPNAQQNVIVVSGEGKVSAAPDIATISFTASEDAATASAAQSAAAKDNNAALAALKTFSIASADIQTSSYNVYPKYSTPAPCVYSASSGVSGGVMMPVPVCPPTESTVIGYTASQSVTVKVRNLDNVGSIVTALGSAGVSNISGPDFTIDNPEAVQAQARSLAIADARNQAGTLAHDLGVSIVRVVSYSENGNNYPGPVMMAADSSAGGKANVAPSVPVGQNDVVVDVSVTYEIR